MQQPVIGPWGKEDQEPETYLLGTPQGWQLRDWKGGWWKEERARGEKEGERAGEGDRTSHPPPAKIHRRSEDIRTSLFCQDFQGRSLTVPPTAEKTATELSSPESPRICTYRY
ncbi:hypothetical protein FKM82_017936 [Ascaphus truei]